MDVISKRRGMLEVMARGRWTGVSSLQRYCKAGKLVKLFSDLAPNMQQFARWAETNLEAVVVYDRPPRPPPAAGEAAPTSYYVTPASRLSKQSVRKRPCGVGSFTRGEAKRSC